MPLTIKNFDNPVVSINTCNIIIILILIVNRLFENIDLFSTDLLRFLHENAYNSSLPIKKINNSEPAVAVLNVFA